MNSVTEPIKEHVTEPVTDHETDLTKQSNVGRNGENGSSQKSSGYETPALERAGNPGASIVIELVLAGDTFVTQGEGKKARREYHPKIARAFSGPQGVTVARCFLEACNQDDELKRKAIDQGIDLEGMAEMLDEADRENRNRDSATSGRTGDRNGRDGKDGKDKR